MNHIILNGSITLIGESDIWSIRYDATSESKEYQYYWFTSVRGYCSNNYRSLARALSEMMRCAKNSDYDSKLEKEIEKSKIV